jgi:hypothetical protein
MIFLGSFGFIIYAIVAAVATFQGKDFRYMIIGSLVDRFMEKK